MPSTVTAVSSTQVSALRDFLCRDAVSNMYALGLLEEFGVQSTEGHAPFEFLARFVDDEMTAAVFVGAQGGLIVPSGSNPSDIADIAKKLPKGIRLQACLGDRSLVDVVLQYLGGIPRLSRYQRLFTVSADDLGPFTNPMLRLATKADLPQLIPMAAACVKEMHRRDPLAEDADGFTLRVSRRVETQRTYVLEEAGRLIFKLDVGPRSQFGAELEMFYTLPSERFKGHATLCLGQISRFLLSSLPRLGLRIDELNPGFADIARKVGYVAGRPQRFVLA